MENPRDFEKPGKDAGPPDGLISSKSGGSEDLAGPGQLKSLEQFMAGRTKKDDAWELTAYTAYFNLLGKIYMASSTKSDAIKAHLMNANMLIKRYYVGEPLNVSLNAAYQGLLGPKPGDDLRKLIPDFWVDNHQWKHYQNGDQSWGLFDRRWEEVHKIIVYGAKLILAVRATQIDQGAVIQFQVTDGYVQFDQPVGFPGERVKTRVNLIKIQISRTSSLASGHGYPVPSADNTDFPVVRGVLAMALLETLSAENDELRSKK